MYCNNVFGYDDNPNDDVIYCNFGYNNNTRYYDLEGLKRSCEGAITNIQSLEKHGYNVNNTFPYYNYFASKCSIFLDTIYYTVYQQKTIKYTDKSCDSVRTLVETDSNFDVKFNQENLKIKKILSNL